MDWDLTLRILLALFGAASCAAAWYNIWTAKGNQKQASESRKLEEAHAMGVANKQSIENLESRMDGHEARTEKRLDQIGSDVAAVKNLFTDFLIENLRTLTRTRT
ncbi:hypothetical protein JAO73_10465 [Hymenobacter sp. BT523]|uniref:hypothetical protein n=1 Tax=Hymenobacter sp. BT523 TaxID=2795725 RepID=UPI0018EB5301|nr:hypothetical protein [Hymenobacter sp. BT523]MBJ6109438.1 hypothetical protein [Hymenobacter sp. BT523]